MVEVRPLCFDECSAVLRHASEVQGIDVHVMVLPNPYVEGPYPPFIATCPHGVVYCSEPTGEQIAEWVDVFPKCPTERPWGTCDWGHCYRVAAFWRWADDLREWLPVCAGCRHKQ